jgi:NTP pyrophosphatase (non-canonical NTP hydrolase)
MQLPSSPTLLQLQAYVQQMCKDRGWDQASDLEIFLLFSEEVGELAKAIRKKRELFSEKGKEGKDFGLAEEFADVLSYLLDLANRFEVDLEQAFREKEALNASREWEGSSGPKPDNSPGDVRNEP